MARKKTAQEKIDFIVENFATMGNKELRKHTGCCLSVIYRTAKEHGLERSERFRKELSGHKQLSDKELDWLMKKYPITENWELADTLGISDSTLHRLARRFGLKKTPAFMRKTQRETVAAAHYFFKKNGPTEAQKRVFSELPEKGREYRFKPGMSNRDRNGEENERMRRISIGVTRRELIRRERLRIKAGLPQKTKLRIKTS